jgi:hypothetical protein
VKKDTTISVKEKGDQIGKVFTLYGLCKQVGRVLLSANGLEVEFSVLILFANTMAADVYMF